MEREARDQTESKYSEIDRGQGFMSYDFHLKMTSDVLWLTFWTFHQILSNLVLVV